jgi:hypothetical protein
MLRRARALGVFGLLAAALAASCGAPPTARFPPVAFAELACSPSGRVECRLLNEGGIGCCTADIDGSAAAWTCPIGFERTLERAPVPIPGLSNVAELTSGGSHMCARSRDGAVRCWGLNEHGQLGQGSFMGGKAPPTFWSRNPERPSRDAGVNGDHVCSSMGDGTMRCAPKSRVGPHGPACEPVTIGDNVFLRCGGAEMVDPAVVLCDGSPAPARVIALSGVAEIQAGDDHTCARLFDGTVRCWGENDKGQLGFGERTRAIPVPTEVPGLEGVTQMAIESGGGCAFSTDGVIRCWGTVVPNRRHVHLNSDNPPGLDEVHMDGAVEMDLSESLLCVRFFNGEISCYGYNNVGETGIPPKPQAERGFAWNRVPGIKDASRVAVGGQFGCALVKGQVYCWGANELGQLGDGSTSHREKPAPVPDLTGVIDISLRGGVACARTGAGDVYCWGNLPGEVPSGEKFVAQTTPRRIEGFTGAVSVQTSGLATCAAMPDGSARCMGLLFPPPKRSSFAAITGAALPPIEAPTAQPKKLPPRRTFSCQRAEVFCCGAYCHASEDSCLDARAFAGAPPDCTCERFERDVMDVLTAGGGLEWRGELCTCFTTDAGAAVCRDKKLEPCELDTVYTALCEANLKPSVPARSSKRARYCFMGVFPMCERTTCVDSPHRQCFSDPEACEVARKSNKESAKQLPVDPACTTIPPPR